MEVEIDNNVELVNSDGIKATVVSEIAVEGESTEELEITVAKKEFVVSGDGLVIPTYYDDAPQWLKDLVDTVVNVSINTRDQAVLNQVQSLLDALEYVPQNQYSEAILQLVTEDGILNTKIEALDSTWGELLNQSNAKIANIEQTYASKDEASAIALQVIDSSITDGTTALGSTVANLASSYSNLNNTVATNQDVLMSTLEGVEDGLEGNATAIQTLETSVGIIDGVPTGTGILADVNILQKQNDGVIETYTGTYDVMTGIEDPNTNVDNDELDVTQEPYATWIAIDAANGNEEQRAMHVGDVYIKYSTAAGGYKNYERAYKFIKTIVDGTSPYATDSEGYTWSVITDTDAQNAYVAALNAYDLADDKRRVFVGLGATSTPSTPYDQGDLWLIDAERNVNGYDCKVGDILRCIENKGNTATYEQNDWVVASSYANALNAQQQDFQNWVDGDYSDELDLIRTQVDKKAESFYQENMPHSEGANIEYAVWVGDLWKKPSTNDEYVYELVNGIYKWVKTDVPDIVYDTIDGKKTIFTGNDVPTAIGVNDMWITGDNPVSPYEDESIYVWNGSAWIKPLKYTNNQYAIDIENGTKQIDISGYDLASSGWENISTTTYAESVLIDWVNDEYTFDQIEKQKDIDGKITSYFTNDNIAPYNPATATLKEDGDLWYDSSTKLLKRYVFNLLSWEVVEDKVAVEAASAASMAQSTADGKIVTFLQTTMPTAVSDEGDIWIDTDDDNHMYRADSNGNWVSVRDTANDLALSDAMQDIAALEETNDGVVNSFYGTLVERDAETSMTYGDWWVDTSSTPVVAAYRYEDTNGKNVGPLSWRDNSNSILGKAYIGMSGAQATADGKIKTFYQGNIPTAEGVGDLWININDNNKTYRAAVKGANEIKDDEWEPVSDTSAIEEYLETQSQIIDSIKQQLDGVAVTYFQDSRPYTVGTPENNGDVWYDISSPTPYAERYNSSLQTWVVISDSNTLSALTDASNTVAASDHIIHTYVTESEPTGSELGVGDIWFMAGLGSEDKDIYSYAGTGGDSFSGRWNKIGTYVNSVTNLDLSSAKINNENLLTYISKEIDKEVVVYSGSDHTTQAGMKENDIYIEKTTATGNSGIAVDVTNTYKYDGSTWIAIGNNSNLTALADLTDGKRTVYSGSALPIENSSNPFKNNDLFIPTITFIDGIKYVENDMYRYYSGSWIPATRYDTIKDELMEQIDGKIDTHYGGATPPFANQVNVAKDSRGGDYWYCDVDGVYVKGSIYKYSESTNGSNFNYTWEESADITKSAFDLLDKKRAIWNNSGNNPPNTVDEPALEVADLWIPNSTSGDYTVGKIYKCMVASATPTWTEVDYTNDDTVIGIQTGVIPLDPETITMGDTSTSFTDYLNAELDKNVNVYSGSDSPASHNFGTSSIQENDLYLWFTAETTNDSNIQYEYTRTYRYLSSTWTEIQSNTNLTALADLADGKRTVFAGSAAPTGAVERDLWIPETDNGTYKKGEVYQYLSDVWTLATRYTEDLSAFVDEVNNTIVPALEDQIDGKIEYWFNVSTDDPKDGWTVAERANRDGDVWYQVDTKESYYYTSDNNSWNAITDKDAIQALQDAAEAQATADNVVVSYYAQYQDTAPATSKLWLNKTGTKVLKEYVTNVWDAVDVKEGDTLTAYDPTTKDISVFVYYNGAWITETENGLVASSEAVTKLNTELTSLGTTVSGHTNLLNTVDARIDAEGARVESKFAYNSNIIINNVAYSGGFGLDINGATSTGTNVVDNGITYPLFNSKFWVKADEFEITNGTTGYTPFSIVGNDITFNGKVNFTNVDGGQQAITDTVKAWSPVYGAVAAYGSAVSSNVKATEEGWIELSSTTDTTIGLSFPAVNVTEVAASGGKVSFSLAMKSTAFYATGVYIRVCEYDNELPLGKTHISHNATTSDPLVQEDTRSITTFYENSLISDKWETMSFSYTPNSTAKWISVVVLNWSGLGTSPLYIKDYRISVETVQDVSGEISSNNDLFAQRLGYISENGYTAYENMVNAASAGETIINGGYINTGLIEANAITANQINTSGLIADNISANTLVGKTIEGGVINGARINGAVIKASYLDLDGELEVLTNYHITIAMYNANPSLYTDAVYISADNEYRIPSISTIYNAGSATQSYNENNVVKYMYISDQIKSYNTANVGHNIKAVKIDPKISVLTSSTYYYSDRTLIPFGEPTNLTVSLCSFYVNNIEVARCYHYFIGGGSWQARIFDVQNGNILSSSTERWGASTTFTAALSNGLSVTLQIQGITSRSSEGGNTYSYIYTVKLNPCLITPINQFTGGNLLHMSYYSYYTASNPPFSTETRTYAYNPASNISINNMI